MYNEEIFRISTGSFYRLVRRKLCTRYDKSKYVYNITMSHYSVWENCYELSFYYIKYNYYYMHLF